MVFATQQHASWMNLKIQVPVITSITHSPPERLVGRDSSPLRASRPIWRPTIVQRLRLKLMPVVMGSGELRGLQIPRHLQLHWKPPTTSLYRGSPRDEMAGVSVPSAAIFSWRVMRFTASATRLVDGKRAVAEGHLGKLRVPQAGVHQFWGSLWWRLGRAGTVHIED